MRHVTISGKDLLRITAGIYQTIDGYFEAYDQGATAPWLKMRAWDGSGFYIEINDEKIKQGLQGEFQEIADEEAQPPYQGLFISIPTPAPVPRAEPKKPPVWTQPAWDMGIFTEHNRKNTSLVSAFFLVDSRDSISRCAQWLSVLKSYNMPDIENSKYFDNVREIYESGKMVANFDYEFKLTWRNQELQAFLRCHFFEPGKYEMEFLIPGVIADEISDQFKDGREGFCCNFMPPMFYD